jgi:hypothetical protein
LPALRLQAVANGVDTTDVTTANEKTELTERCVPAYAHASHDHTRVWTHVGHAHTRTWA